MRANNRAENNSTDPGMYTSLFSNGDNDDNQSLNVSTHGASYRVRKHSIAVWAPGVGLWIMRRENIEKHDFPPPSAACVFADAD